MGQRAHLRPLCAACSQPPDSVKPVACSEAKNHYSSPARVRVYAFKSRLELKQALPAHLLAALLSAYGSLASPSRFEEGPAGAAQRNLVQRLVLRAAPSCSLNGLQSVVRSLSCACSHVLLSPLVRLSPRICCPAGLLTCLVCSVGFASSVAKPGRVRLRQLAPPQAAPRTSFQPQAFLAPCHCAVSSVSTLPCRAFPSAQLPLGSATNFRAALSMLGCDVARVCVLGSGCYSEPPPVSVAVQSARLYWRLRRNRCHASLWRCFLPACANRTQSRDRGTSCIAAASF